MGIIQSIRRGVAKVFGAKIREDIFFNDFEGKEEPDHPLYRRMQTRSFRSAQRDLPPFQQDEQNKQAFTSFIKNPFLRRLAKMVAEFIVGNGMQPVSKNELVQKELDEWWTDPVNDLDKRHYTMALEFGLYGELIPERVVNAFTGRHRYNFLDPLFVAQVNPHRDFPGVPASIDFWERGQTSAGSGTVRARILNGVPEAALLSGHKTGMADDPMVFYFRTNNLSGSLRGHSNFYPLIEWADILDNAGFTMGERMVIMLQFMWHLKSGNLDAETKKTYKKLFQAANPGALLMTNKEVELAAIAPDLKAADFTEGARFIRNLLAGAAGVPEHFMGEGGDVNRATALAMNLPTLRSFLQQQREFVEVLRTMARANLVSVAQRGRIPMDEVDNFQIQVDPMNPQDTGAVTSALGGAVSALSAAKLEGWITDNEARQTIRTILGGTIELDENVEAEEEAEAPTDSERGIDTLMGEEEEDDIPVRRNGLAG